MWSLDEYGAGVWETAGRYAILYIIERSRSVGLRSVFRMRQNNNSRTLGERRSPRVVLRLACDSERNRVVRYLFLHISLFSRCAAAGRRPAARQKSPTLQIGLHICIVARYQWTPETYVRWTFLRVFLRFFELNPEKTGHDSYLGRCYLICFDKSLRTGILSYNVNYYGL